MSAAEEAFRHRMQGVVEGLARAIDNPEVIARKAADWLEENEPERISTALWIDVNGDHDRGIQVRIFEQPLSLGRLPPVVPGVLIGQNTAGLNVSMPIFTTAKGVHVSAGLGAVTSLDEEIGREWSPVASVSIRIPLGRASEVETPGLELKAERVQEE